MGSPRKPRPTRRLPVAPKPRQRPPPRRLRVRRRSRQRRPPTPTLPRKQRPMLERRQAVVLRPSLPPNHLPLRPRERPLQEPRRLELPRTPNQRASRRQPARPKSEFQNSLEVILFLEPSIRLCELKLAKTRLYCLLKTKIYKEKK